MFNPGFVVYHLIGNLVVIIFCWMFPFLQTLAEVRVSPLTTELPEMKMYIFAEHQDQSEIDRSGQLDNKALHMVIFTSEDELTANKQDAYDHHGEDLKLSFSDDQVDIYAEEEQITDFQMEYSLDSGYRVDDLDWRIAGPTGVPNILSELEWKNIEIVQVKLGASMTFDNNWYFEGSFAYGWAFDGQNQDSDFNGNNRTQEFSRSNNDASDSSVLDASLGVGYHFNFGGTRNNPYFRITPKIGYSFHNQHMKITRGFQTIPGTGSFGGLDSTYDANWYGPWVGLDGTLMLMPNFRIFATVAGHLAFYNGTGNWNLREDFQNPKSFTHESEGYGLTASLGSSYIVNPDWSVRLSVDYQKWEANDSGIDKTFFSDGTLGETKFNGVTWDSVGANIGVSFRF